MAIYGVTSDNIYATNLVDTRTGKILATVVRDVKFLNDEVQFLVRDSTNQWQLWNNGHIFCKYEGVKGVVNWKFNATGSLFAVMTRDNRVQIWNVSDCKLMHELSFDE